MCKAESPRLSPLWLSASSSACHGLLIITIDNAITYKAQRDRKCRELKRWRTAITDMQMRQRDVAALDAKYTKELMLKLENDALRDSVAAGRFWHIKAVCQSVREAIPPPAWIMQPPRLADTAERDWHPQREADPMQKQLEGTQKYINEQCR